MKLKDIHNKKLNTLLIIELFFNIIFWSIYKYTSTDEKVLIFGSLSLIFIMPYVLELIKNLVLYKIDGLEFKYVIPIGLYLWSIYLSLGMFWGKLNDWKFICWKYEYSDLSFLLLITIISHSFLNPYGEKYKGGKKND